MKAWKHLLGRSYWLIGHILSVFLTIELIHARSHREPGTIFHHSFLETKSNNEERASNFIYLFIFFQEKTKVNDSVSFFWKQKTLRQIQPLPRSAGISNGFDYIHLIFKWFWLYSKQPWSVQSDTVTYPLKYYTPDSEN